MRMTYGPHVMFGVTGLTCAAFVCSSFGGTTNTTKTFIDYFLPTPIVGAISKDAPGAAEVGPRDMKNGLEQTSETRWSYWDGQIIKGPDGKYHLFCSGREQSGKHTEWYESKAVHAVSDNLIGPYVHKRLCWPDNQAGQGHNVTALVMPDGSYAIMVSGTSTRLGDVFVSKSLDGPWKYLGKVKGEGLVPVNISIMVRPDGDFMIFPRSGIVYISKSGILGPYQAQGKCVYEDIPELMKMPAMLRGGKIHMSYLEDPAIWFSGGLYHIVVNQWHDRKAYHLTSADGIKGWKFRGLAYDPDKDFIRYTDGTVNRWGGPQGTGKLERPGVLVENGHVVAMTLAASKELNKGMGTITNSQGVKLSNKIIVIPFDGEAMDRDLQNVK